MRRFVTIFFAALTAVCLCGCGKEKKLTFTYNAAVWPDAGGGTV